jgi:tetratricopeptide (TPR) repeat protein
MLHAFEEALQIDPNNYDALCGMGFAYLEVNMYAEALERLEGALDVCPSSGRALYGAATALLELGRLDEASSYALRLRDLNDPRSTASSLFIRGTIAYNQGEFAQAAEHLEGSFSRRRSEQDRQPTWRRNCYLLAQSYVELNRPEQALHYLKLMNGDPDRRGRRDKPWSRKLEDQIGRLHLELGQIREAIESFDRILSRHPNDERALNGLGQAYLARHDGERAMEAFKKVLAQNRNDIWALDGMAEACKLKGDLARAAGYIERVRSLRRE